MVDCLSIRPHWWLTLMRITVYFSEHPDCGPKQKIFFCINMLIVHLDKVGLLSPNTLMIDTSMKIVVCLWTHWWKAPTGIIVSLSEHVNEGPWWGWWFVSLNTPATDLNKDGRLHLWTYQWQTLTIKLFFYINTLMINLNKNGRLSLNTLMMDLIDDWLQWRWLITDIKGYCYLFFRTRIIVYADYRA